MNFKHLLVSLVLSIAGGLAGCQSVGESMKAHFTKAPVVRTIEAGRDRAFQASLAALKAMNYTVSRSRQHEGLIEAIGRISADTNLRSAQQYTLRIQVVATIDGRAEVRVEAREQFEEQGIGGTMVRNERPIPQGAPHNRFFEELLRQL